MGCCCGAEMMAPSKFQVTYYVYINNKARNQNNLNNTNHQIVNEGQANQNSQIHGQGITVEEII